MFRVKVSWQRTLAALVAVSLGVVWSAQAARADDHLPIVDIVPLATWAGAENAFASANPKVLPEVSGTTWITGTATLPLMKNLAFSYDRIQGDLIGNTLVPGGSFNDIAQVFRLDSGVIKSINLEAALFFRHRVCCPGSADPHGAPSTEQHQGQFGITYTSPSFGKGLLNTLLVLNVTGHTANHNPGPVTAASWHGLDITCPTLTKAGACTSYGSKQEYGTSQAATLVIPVDPRHGFIATATYLWGTLDYFEDFPFADGYNVWVFGVDKRINPYISLKMTAGNLWQRPQGAPIPPPAVIHEVSYTTSLDFHLDFNKIFAPPPPPSK